MENHTTHDPVCAICEGPLENAHLLDPECNWICTPCDIEEQKRWVADMRPDEQQVEPA